MSAKLSLGKQKRSDMIFYACLMAFPIVQFIIMYVCVNFNSILLAFRSYDTISGEYSFAGFENFEQALFTLFKSPTIGKSWSNSFIAYLIGTFISTPLALLFSFYIYKKMFLHNAFKVLLFLPSVISVVVMAILYRYFMEKGLPELFDSLFNAKIDGMFSNGDTVFFTLVFFSMFMGVGPNILMYVGAMGGISESLSESAQLDGSNRIQEFWYITIPCIWPTIVTFLVVNLITIFSNQLNLYNFYQGSADLNLYTFGYYLFRKTQTATSVSEYPLLAAIGLLFTFVIVPVTLIARKLLVKFGPSVE